MRFLHSNLGDKTMRVVGLIITFALLFFCAISAWQNRKDIISMAEGYINQFQVEEVNKEEIKEVEEEPVEPMLDPNKPMIVLTFDDGPSIYTEELLNILQQNDARATFFVLGDRAAKYPEMISRIQEMSCEIGNHTYYHTNLTKVTPEMVQAEIEWTNDAVRNVLGEGTNLVRPPYGAADDMVVANTAYPIVLWSVDTTDWQLKDANAVAQHILGTAKDGDVVLMHDIYSSTVEAMKIVIPELKARGYQVVTFSEMMEAHGIAMEPGQKYFNCY